MAASYRKGEIYMFKKILIFSLLLLMIISFASLAYADVETLTINNTETGLITITLTTNNEHQVLILKDGQRALYTITETTQIPLQMGNGDYTIRVYEKLNGRSQLVMNTIRTLELEDESSLYLASVQNVNWNTEMVAIKLAAELTAGLETDSEKINAIYNYVVSNITYDYEKARTVTGGYIPTIDSTIADGNGICYDYASLLASMLRSVNIPTKLSIGHLGSLYHAWNQVYLSETNEWITVDSTNDALYNKYGLSYEMAKTSPLYAVEMNY